jgi:hypothetical protein
VRKPFGVAGLLVLFCSFPHAAAAQEPLEDLEAGIGEAIELARAGVDDPFPELMERVRAAVGLPLEVEVAGRTISLPRDPLLERLDGSRAADFRAALLRLEALRDAVGATRAAGPADEAELRRELEGAYEGLGETRPGLLERFRRQVAALLSAAQQRTIEALRGGPAWIVLVVAAALAVLALWRLRLRPVPLARAARGRRAPSPAEWRRRAEEARRRGDAAAAVVALYRSLVAGLAERGLVEDRPSLTAGEVRAAVGATPPGLSVAMAEATRRYERVRYGMAPPTDEDIAALADAERRARGAWAG